MRREPELREERLLRLTQIHPAWVDAFRRLAELQRSEDDLAGACETIERFLEHHADLVPASEAGRLRARYCEGDG